MIKADETIIMILILGRMKIHIARWTGARIPKRCSSNLVSERFGVRVALSITIVCVCVHQESDRFQHIQRRRHMASPSSTSLEPLDWQLKAHSN